MLPLSGYGIFRSTICACLFYYIISIFVGMFLETKSFSGYILQIFDTPFCEKSYKE